MEFALFCRRDPQELKEDVNAFVKRKKVKNVRHYRQNVVQGGAALFIYCSFFYECEEERDAEQEAYLLTGW